MATFSQDVPHIPATLSDFITEATAIKDFPPTPLNIADTSAFQAPKLQPAKVDKRKYQAPLYGKEETKRQKSSNLLRLGGGDDDEDVISM